MTQHEVIIFESTKTCSNLTYLERKETNDSSVTLREKHKYHKTEKTKWLLSRISTYSECGYDLIIQDQRIINHEKDTKKSKCGRPNGLNPSVVSYSFISFLQK